MGGADEMTAQTLAEVRALGQVEADGWVTAYSSAPVEQRDAHEPGCECDCGKLAADRRAQR